MDDEQMADFYDKKYGGRNRVQSFKGSAEDVPQQLLLPSVNDPNLWMIKCKVIVAPAHAMHFFSNLLNLFLEYSLEKKEMSFSV